MFPWKINFLPFVPFEYLLVVAYAFTLSMIGITPLSFEDHSLLILFLHILLLIFAPLRFKQLTTNPLKLCVYAMGFVFVHLGTQLLFSLVGIPICKLGFALTWYGQTLISVLVITGIVYWSCMRELPSRLVLFGFVLFFLSINLWDLYTQPALYFFHPTFGYFPGPIYDEWIPRDAKVYLYQVWALGLSLLFFTKQTRATAIWVIVPIVLGSVFSFRSTHKNIQNHLSNTFYTKHAIVYGQENFSTIQLDSVDYWIETISDELQIDPPSKKIKVYVFKDDLLKKKLTGTQHTLIGNPMQQSLHLLELAPWEPIFVHELTHVLAASLSSNILKMNPNMAITEGLAMAMQKVFLGFDVHLWAKALIEMEYPISLDYFYSTKRFYTLPPAHAYGLSGSFVLWMIQNQLDIKSLYLSNINPGELESEWLAYIHSLEISDEQLSWMKKVLTQKSVFQKKCPHEIAHAQFHKNNCSHTACKHKWIQYAYSCNPKDPNLQKQYGLTLLEKGFFPKAHTLEIPQDWITLFESNTVSENHLWHPLVQQDPSIYKSYLLNQTLDFQTIDPKTHSQILWQIYSRQNQNIALLELMDPSQLNLEDKIKYWKEKSKMYEKTDQLEKAIESLEQALQIKNSLEITLQWKRLQTLQTFWNKKENPAQTKPHQP